jgi:hypothetical protein
LAFALSWGSLRLYSSRIFAEDKEYVLPPNDDQWTFGQVIAIFLLTLPWLSLIQDFLSEFTQY